MPESLESEIVGSHSFCWNENRLVLSAKILYHFTIDFRIGGSP